MTQTKKIEEGQSYIFKYNGGLTTTNSATTVSEDLKNKYTKWAQVSGKTSRSN